MNCRSLPKLFLAAFASCLFGSASGANETVQIRPLHQPGLYDFTNSRDESGRIVLKLLDGSGLRARNGKLQLIFELENSSRFARHGVTRTDLRREVARANSLIADAGLQAGSLIVDDEAELARQQQIAEGYWGHEVAELASYTQLIGRIGEDFQRHEHLLHQLNELKIVEVAYIEPRAQVLGIADNPPSAQSCNSSPVPPGLGDLTAHQGYLGAPPMGINSLAAHLLPGGRGEGVRVIDIEGGVYEHSDLPELFMTVGEMLYKYAKHGTSVIGVIGAKSNGIGTTGLAPDASIGFRSIYNSNLFEDWNAAMLDDTNVASNIYFAAKHSMKGVVLLELQRLGPPQEVCSCTTQSCLLVPVEFWPADFDTIQTAVGNGSVVVEAAANGGRNLDHLVLGGAFDRKIRDSGAILVTGSRSDGITPMCYQGSPNHGSRVDLHSWGEDVATTGNTQLFNGPGICHDYTNKFNGSSSASAIVAGAVTSLQGVHLQLFGAPADPLYLRNLMTTTGTPQAAGTEDLWIGQHPDLLKAIEAMSDQDN